MQKEELERLLGDGGAIPDLGPIEDHIRAIAAERELPDFAIAMCTARIEEAAPVLRAVLVRAADGEALTEDDERLLFRGLHILGAGRDTASFQPLLRLLRRPIDEVDALLGDTITESLAKIAAGVFDGGAGPLFEFICDRSVDEFIREALFGAATFLAWEGRIERGAMEDFLKQFYDKQLAPDGDQAWIGWLEAIAHLGLRNLAPLVYRAWENGRIPGGVLEPRHFEADLSAAERAPGDAGRFEDANLGYIDDIIVGLDWARHVDTVSNEWDEERNWTDWAPQTPAVNPYRHVGRNDPCPCGSGKKAKKCCLGS
jgi:Protein of unknown function (DUF1186)/SEC-C motif